MTDNSKRTNKPDVTQDSFNQAIEQLRAKGQPVSIRNVRSLQMNASAC